MKYPEAIQNLIDRFSELPSVGPKTAERYVFYLLKKGPADLEKWLTDLKALQAETTVCRSCRAIAAQNPCPICSASGRRRDTLCVIENTQDLAAVEATGQYDGLYFVLDGLINTIEDIQPKDINIGLLAERIKSGSIKEMILALNFTLEGETTALYLGKLFKGRLKISRLAKGLPAGSDLEYADSLTLSSALKNRNEMG